MFIILTTDYFEFKNYFGNLLSFSEDTKNTNLFPSGWCDDTAQEFGVVKCPNTEPTDTNAGFVARSEWFRTGFQSANPYRPEGKTFFGVFRHELYGINKGLLPHTKVSFKLTRSSNAFFVKRLIKSDTPDTTKYKAILTSICLYIKVGQMNIALYDTIKSRFETTPVKYYYRKLQVKTEQINAYSVIHQTNSLWPDSTQPIKVFFAIVDTKALAGDYEKNPYCFIRKWEIKTSAKVTCDYATNAIQASAIATLEQKVRNMFQNQQDLLYNLLCQKKCKKKTDKVSSKNCAKTSKKKSIPGTSSSNIPIQSTSAAAAEEETSVPQLDGNPETESGTETESEYVPDSEEEDEEESDSESTASENFCSASSGNRSQTVTCQSPSRSRKEALKKFKAKYRRNHSTREEVQLLNQRSMSSLEGDTTEIVYVKDFELDVGGARIDQLKLVSSEDEAMEPYIRFLCKKFLCLSSQLINY